MYLQAQRKYHLGLKVIIDKQKNRHIGGSFFTKKEFKLF